MAIRGQLRTVHSAIVSALLQARPGCGAGGYDIGWIDAGEWLNYATRRVPELQREDDQREADQLRQLEREKAQKVRPRRTSESNNALQQPRVFYRRETELQPLVIARP